MSSVTFKIRKYRYYYFLVCVTTMQLLAQDKERGLGPIFKDSICFASARTGFDLELLYSYYTEGSPFCIGGEIM